MTPVIEYQGTNHRGEPSQPRVDLLAVGQLLDRAACAVRLTADRLRAAGEYPGPEPYQVERELIRALREIRALRCRRKRRMRWVRERD
jgi:hypothetical protein